MQLAQTMAHKLSSVVKSALSTNTSDLVIYGTTKTTKRIVVVGATGSAKSTSLNVLATCGDEMIFDEAPPGSVHPHTINTNEHEMPQTLFNQHIVFVDTPGLNDALDYALQRQLLERLQRLDDIAVVVFCCPFNAKITPEFKQTIQYYSRVFEPVMRDGCFGLFFTHLSGDAYQHMLHVQESGGVKISDLIEKKAKEIANEFNIQFSFVWLMGKIFPYQVRSVQEEHKKYDEQIKDYYNHQRSLQMHEDQANYHQSDSRHQHHSIPCPGSIGCMSLETRKNLLDFVVRTHCTSMNSHEFPLPPGMESVRVMAVNVVYRLLESNGELIKVTQPHHSSLLARKNECFRLETRKNEDVNKLEREIETLQSEKSCTYVKGVDNIIEFMRYAKEVKENIPVQPSHVVPTTYNCRIENERYDPNEKKYVFDVVPNFLNLYRDELEGEWHRWFCHVTFKWDGKLSNRDKIEAKRSELQQARESVEEQIAETERISKEFSQTDTDLKEYEKHRQRLTDDLKLLQKNLFKLSEFGQIDETLSRYKASMSQDSSTP